MLRLDAVLSDVTRSLLRGAPALTAAGLAPASLMQHLDRTVQAWSCSGRTTLLDSSGVPPSVAGSGYSPHPWNA